MMKVRLKFNKGSTYAVYNSHVEVLAAEVGVYR
jgi:hypothetical protein